MQRRGDAQWWERHVAQQSEHMASQLCTGVSSIYQCFLFLSPRKDFINIIKKKSFSGEVKDSVIFLFFFYFISFINLCSPFVFPLAHPRELKTSAHPSRPAHRALKPKVL